MNLKQTIVDLEAEIRRLTIARDALISLRGQAAPKRKPIGRRKWSAEARARQSRMMKQRWAKRRKPRAE